MEYNYALVLLVGLLFNNLVAGQYSSSTTYGKSSSEHADSLLQKPISGQQGQIVGLGSVGHIQDAGSLQPLIPSQGGQPSGIVQDQSGVGVPIHDHSSQFPFVKTSSNLPVHARSFGGLQAQVPYYPYSSKGSVLGASPYYGYNPYYSAPYVPYPSVQSYSALPYSAIPYSAQPYSYPSAASIYPSASYFGYPSTYPYNYNAGAYVPGLPASYYQQASPVEVQTSVKDKK